MSSTFRSCVGRRISINATARLRRAPYRFSPAGTLRLSGRETFPYGLLDREGGKLPAGGPVNRSAGRNTASDADQPVPLCGRVAIADVYPAPLPGYTASVFRNHHDSHVTGARQCRVHRTGYSVSWRKTLCLREFIQSAGKVGAGGSSLEEIVIPDNYNDITLLRRRSAVPGGSCRLL